MVISIPINELFKKEPPEMTKQEIARMHKSINYDRLNAMADVIDKIVYAGDKGMVMFNIYTLLEIYRAFGHEWKSEYASLCIALIRHERGW
jgi:hypothetical protein